MRTTNRGEPGPGPRARPDPEERRSEVNRATGNSAFRLWSILHGYFKRELLWLQLKFVV